MKKNICCLGMLVMVLTFGMTVAGCTGNNTDSKLNGTWDIGDGGVIKFKNGEFENLIDGSPWSRGIYTTNGNTITIISDSFGPETSIYSISGNTLTLSNESGDITTTVTRINSGSDTKLTKITRDNKSKTTSGSKGGRRKTVPGKGLAEKLIWLESNAESGGSYIFEVRTNESIDPKELTFGGRSDVTITLKGVGSNRAISLSSNGSMFTIGSGITLVLDTITLYGRSNNDSSMVDVIAGGTLIMNNGSIITGNTTAYNGGGVYVGDKGTFTMNGGEISGNTGRDGGGVYVLRNATFTMSGGKISGNTNGGGVYVYDKGTFTMDGGEISGNTSSGVNVDQYGTFTMDGGKISGNTGCGVFVQNSGTFTMSGGTISGNSNYGVSAPRRTFTKTGGTIFGNTPDDVRQR